MPEIYVIIWSHSDGSSFGAVRAYCDRESAEYDLEVMEKISDRVLTIETVGFVGSLERLGS